MTRILMRALAGIGIALCAVAIAACGSNDEGDDAGGFASGAPIEGAKKGGTLKVVSASDVDQIDPGQAYYQLTYLVTSATQTPLYAYRPQDPEKPVPLLAESDPQVSPDGRTVTIKVRSGFRFSPPVNRAVTSKDVKYALTRGFFPSVANQYVQNYLGALEGSGPVVEGDTKELRGIQTPDDRTLVLRFTTDIGATAAQALVLPASAPVPEEYAREFDAKKQSDYGFNQVATGPYMIRNDARGKAVGYQPGRKIELVRNPNWAGGESGDFRPAYVDRVDWSIGGNPTVIGRQVLNGRDMINGDTVPAPVVKQAATRSKQQITFAPLGNRFIPLNMSEPPFDDVNVRKAVAASIDRTRLQLVRGGRLTGKVATHFLPPGAPGFEAAGGLRGSGHDFLAKPEGDMELAAEYLRKAGFANGRYSGPAITMVGTADDPGSQVVLDQFRKLGFKVNYRSLSQDAMFGACAAPARKVNVCPNYGWLPDFSDGYAYLYGTFNGKAIAPQQNSNWSQLKDPKIDAAMDRAARITDPQERADAWGRIDDQITATAAAVPTYWDDVPNIQSRDVRGVIAKWNGAWDLSFTSLE